MRLRKGNWYGIEFLDHVASGDKPLKFVAVGRLICTTKASITIRGWDYADHPKARVSATDPNLVQWCLLKSCITKLFRLVEVKENSE